jgi:hypothetical protein
MLGKYPDLSSIKRHPAHKDLTVKTRYSKKLFSRIQKTNGPAYRQIFSNSVINAPSKLNTFNSKRTSPLPPLSASLDSPADLIFFNVSSEEPHPKKMMQKLQNCSNYEQFQNTYMRRFIKELPQIDKKRKNLSLDERNSREYPLDFSQKAKERGIYQKVKGKMKLVEMKEKKKNVKESDSQTNDTEYEFHLIVEDDGNENELALMQVKMVEEIENRILKSQMNKVAL